MASVKEESSLLGTAISCEIKTAELERVVARLERVGEVDKKDSK